MKARRRDKCYSPIEVWEKKETILESWLQNKPRVSLLEMREQIWKMGFECNAFKATLAISIYKMFQSTRILDFSAGWGDRLLAAIAYGADRYLGYDPNPELQHGYQEMIQMFTPNSRKNQHYEVKMEAFETANIPETETFDLILTSPPYYDFETYISSDKEAAKTQSIVKYPRFHIWMVEFLFTSLHKCWNRLDIGGNMVIHLSDVYKTNYVEAMIIFILGWCEGSRFDGSIASIGDCGKPRPLWVFHKLDSVNIFQEQIMKTRERMKIHYSDLYIILQKI
jgi:16S rRNA G966 N2-methylase RsmD